MVVDIEQPGQCKLTRLCSVLAIAVLAGLGGWRLCSKLEAASWGVSSRATMWIATMVPAGLFVGLALLIFWLVNKSSIADFMIAAEGEMKKVSWSTKKEVIGSTKVVIVTTFIMAGILFGEDILLTVLFKWLGIMGG